MTSETATLFQRLTRGAYFVIGAAHEERRDIFAAASVMQASHTPLLLAVGVNPRASLDNNDGHGFFRALGDSVITGPTLTNVNDFRAILIE